MLSMVKNMSKWIVIIIVAKAYQTFKYLCVPLDFAGAQHQVGGCSNCFSPTINVPVIVMKK